MFLLHQTKKLFHNEKNDKQKERFVYLMGKDIANDIDKELIFKIYKNSYNST